ncbi:hypothetical protein MMC06_004718 [Schaereria dolodes]|nr:hypothetical protein [Schaereria dolodes]
MSGPPPPPPPPPMPGFGGGGPPPPPPLPGGPLNSSTLPARPPPTVTKDRGALLTDITKGARLKKAVTNDRSAPVVGNEKSPSTGPPVGGAPAIPGLGRPPPLSAPPVPGLVGLNRARSSSDVGGSNGDAGGIPVAPQLGGIFAGGMPKLKKRGGGVDTGANVDAHQSDPETSRSSALKPPLGSVPKPPMIGAFRPSPKSTESSPPQPRIPVVANLRKPPLKPAPRPFSDIPLRSTQSTSDVMPPRAPPPLPGLHKPPPPPITSRKPSSTAPPPPPPSTAPSPSAAPPLPATSAVRLPPQRYTPPPPPAPGPLTLNGLHKPSLAEQAARNAFGSGPASPGLSSPVVPPPPPPISPSSMSSPPPSASLLSRPPAAAAPSPTSPLSRPPAQQPARSMLDPSSYTLSNGISSNHTSPRGNGLASKAGSIKIEDLRWRFQDDGQLPKPRDFVGGPKRYRAGRGSSVPLDLSQLG